MTQAIRISTDEYLKPAFRILRLPDVIAKVGLSRAQIYHLISLGEFPSQVKLGLRACGWVEAEIDGWIERLVYVSRKEGV